MNTCHEQKREILCVGYPGIMSVSFICLDLLYILNMNTCHEQKREILCVCYPRIMSVSFICVDLLVHLKHEYMS